MTPESYYENVASNKNIFNAIKRIYIFSEVLKINIFKINIICFLLHPLFILSDDLFACKNDS